MRRLLALVVMLCCIPACQEQMIAAFGSNSGITIVTTSRCEEIARDLAASLEREIVTVQYERAYDITLITTGDLKNHDSRKNIILIDYLEPPSKVSRSILDLSAGRREDVRSGGANIFHREDRWAKGQVVVGIAAPTPKVVVKNIIAVYGTKKISTRKIVNVSRDDVSKIRLVSNLLFKI